MIDEIFNENEDVEAYAKLQGIGIKLFITKKIVIIGREPGEETEFEQKLTLTGSQKISRQHMKIFWDSNDRCWKIKSLSKNKIYVNKELITKDDEARKLEDCAALRFDKFLVYFFPAI